MLNFEAMFQGLLPDSFTLRQHIMRRSRIFLTMLWASLLCLSTSLAQTPVQLDPDFTHYHGNQALISQPLKVAVQPDGKILVVGNINMFQGGFIPAGITRLNPDGTPDPSFNQGGAGSFGKIHVVRVLPNGQLLIGGDFLYYNNIPVNGFARLHADGTPDTTFATFSAGGVGGNLPVVSDIEVLGDGKIMISGGLTTVNGTAVNKVARLNADGTLDTGFSTPGGFLPNASARVTCIAVQGDGKIVAGGNFTQINGSSYDHMVRFNTDGSIDPSFTADPDYNTDVSSMEVHDVEVTTGGKILAAGNFKNALDRIQGIVRFLPDGSIDTGFNTNAPQGTAGSTFVQDIALQPDGKIVMGGGFSTYNNVPRENIARLHADGDLDADFDTQDGFSSNVHGVAIQPDGKILAVGVFMSFAGDSATSVARLLGNGAPTAVQVATEPWMTVSNPFGDWITLSGVHPGLESARLYDAQGRLVQGWCLAGAATQRLVIPSLPGGMYLLQVEGAGKLVSRRLLKVD